jgi:hypothetical protein
VATRLRTAGVQNRSCSDMNLPTDVVEVCHKGGPVAEVGGRRFAETLMFYPPSADNRCGEVRHRGLVDLL